MAERCEVELLTRPDEAFTDPEGPHVVQVVGARVNGVLVPVPRGSFVKLEGPMGHGALRLTLTLAPSRVRFEVADDGVGWPEVPP